MNTESADPLFNRVALIGLGLIGSSLGYAMKRANLAGTITGASRTAETRKAAKDLGFVDEIYETNKEAVHDADLVIVCVPVGICGAVTEEIAPALKPGSILTDVASTKVSVVRDMLPHVPDGVHLIPGHPVAGSERSGPSAGYAELFDERWCILTPLENSDEAKVEKLEAFWRGCGSYVERMDVEHHDMVLAIVSHLPHLIAYSIVMTASHLEEVTESEVIKFSAGGFRDFTRIAASDPTMWRDVFVSNKGAVLEMLGRFSEDLAALQKAIRHEDGEMLFDLFTKSRDIRRGIVEAGQDTAEPNFGRIVTSE
ncbi:MAG: prephenate/arogenate dehydrogenase family protein [Hyphomicrobiales bacterium]